MTVNGKQVTVTAPPRMTLADALRDRLGLTGTHLGCEHGICGMCTVLVDGQAARSCLLFACQLDGAEVLTVEGLGRPGELHPLQQAFGRHHALQCGFCTPGFLLSAYDLLRHRPEVTQDELAAELSGVLCRCTGYRNILSAVAEAARAHPDGLPAPLNCADTSLRHCRRGHGRRTYRRGRVRGRRRGDRNGGAGGGRHGGGRRPVWVSALASTAREIPKSMTRGPSWASSTLAGLRSRCTTPTAWIAARPSASPLASASTDPAGSGPCSMTASASEGPST